MNSSRNCVRFYSGDEGLFLLKGLPVERGRSPHHDMHVVMRQGQFGYDFRLRDNDMPLKEIHGGRQLLLSADLVNAEGPTLPSEASYEFVPLAEDKDDVTIIMTYPESNDAFSPARREKIFAKTTWRIGMEGPGRLHETGAQDEMSHCRGSQLFRLKKGETAYYFTEGGYVTAIEAGDVGSFPLVHKPDNWKLAEWICTSLSEYANNHQKARVWSALSEIGLRHWQDRFCECFPDFKVD